MVFSWLTNRRRRRLLAEPVLPAWLDFLANNVRHYRHLPPHRQARVRQIVRIMVAEKNFEGGSGFQVSEEMKVTIAGQAAILAIGMKEPYYFDDVRSIIVYPGAYTAGYDNRGEFVDGPSDRLGEAWYHGPIILSWRDLLAAGRNASNGHNLVLHEFAHYVDALDGEVDGTPPLVGRERQRTWFRVTEAEYLRLVGQARRNEVSLLDHYGATNRAEFFAVATECFFEQPRAMWRKHRELYRVLRDFYRQHPARWLPDAAVTHWDRAAAAPRRSDGVLRRQRHKRLAVLRSRNSEALFALALQYFSEDRYALAAAAATRVIALDPGDGEAFVHRALARVKLGRYDAALADAAKALACDADDAEAYVARAAALLGAGECEPAKEELDRALALGHDDADLRYYRGRAWMAMGKPSQAVADFDRAVAARPLAAELYYHRGLAKRALGNESEAESDRAKAIQLDPQVERKCPSCPRIDEIR